MAIGSLFTQFLNRGIGPSLESNKKGPFLNSIITTINNTEISSTILTQRKKAMMKWYEERVPELTGLVNKVARDCNEKVFFEPLKNGDSGRNKVMKARKFYSDNLLRQTYFSQFVDALMTGESYLWISLADMKKVKEVVGRYLEKKGMPNTEYNRAIMLKANFDETQMTLRDLRTVASSTMENIYDDHEIKFYVQKVAMVRKQFSREEIIHTRLMDVNGRPGGFTPLSACLIQLELDWFMWRNQRSLARNGGQPDRLYSVEDIDINNPAFHRIEKELKKYHMVDNRHGSLLLNGKITVQDLQQLETMQFKDLGVYIAGVLALQWSVPRSRIPFMSKEANVKEDSGGNSEKDYYDNIEFYQDTFSALQNRHFWNPFFGVNMQFEKSYTQDQIRETTNTQQRLTNLGMVSMELGKVGKQLKPDYILRFINGANEEIALDDIEEKPEEPIIDNTLMAPSQGVSKGQPKKSAMEDNPAQSNMRQNRANQQQNAMAARGKPTGFGKEQINIKYYDIDHKDMLKQDIEGKEIQRVPFITFVRLYQEDKTLNLEPPKVFMSVDGEMSRFVYKSTDLVYESVVPNSEVTDVSMKNFRKVYRIDNNGMLQILDDKAPDASDLPDTQGLVESQ